MQLTASSSSPEIQIAEKGNEQPINRNLLLPHLQTVRTPIPSTFGTTPTAGAVDHLKDKGPLLLHMQTVPLQQSTESRVHQVRNSTSLSEFPQKAKQTILSIKGIGGLPALLQPIKKHHHHNLRYPKENFPICNMGNSFLRILTTVCIMIAPLEILCYF